MNPAEHERYKRANYAWVQEVRGKEERTIEALLDRQADRATLACWYARAVQGRLRVTP